ncbi:MAG: hypothetical protein MI757_19615 [Pirellulales bacterium]|nr:hypothetical protein [Pirellulales bacterium]
MPQFDAGRARERQYIGRTDQDVIANTSSAWRAGASCEETGYCELRKSELEMRQLYISLQLGERVEVVHEVKIGFKEHITRTVGTVVNKERRQCGVDSGFARNWDDKYWFDHLILRKDDGELTSLTMDEYTQLKRLA